MFDISHLYGSSFFNIVGYAALVCCALYFLSALYQSIVYREHFVQCSLSPWLHQIVGFDVSDRPRPYYFSQVISKNILLAGKPDLVFKHRFLRYFTIVDFKSRTIGIHGTLSLYERLQMSLYMYLGVNKGIRARGLLIYRDRTIPCKYEPMLVQRALAQIPSLHLLHKQFK